MQFDPGKYWEQRLNREFSLYGVGFLGLGRNFNHWMYKVRKRGFLRFAGSLGIEFSRSRVLDVGSGTGFYVEQWAKLGVKELVGVDITQVAVENLSLRYPEYAFHRLDIGNRIHELEKASFDVVSAMDVLFHIVDDEKYANALRNIHGLLKPGGYFIWSENFMKGEALRTRHQVCRSDSFIKNLLLDAGFKIIGQKPLFYLMNTPVTSRSRLLNVSWKLVAGMVKNSEILGLIVGALLYPLESILTAAINQGPSTDIMLCRRPLGI
ncbi:MAG: class I SAM-dependent methyltransferase [Deltaproteobacteria bacterium]|nr:class I SAM-dependent methyltransferase [Deltaproteobacteria bacterium]